MADVWLTDEDMGRTLPVVYVVVDNFSESDPKWLVHGVYDNEHQARLAAFHPHSNLTILRFELNGRPVNEAEVVEP